ncbi:hypothetical protein Lbir_3038 [Legionella birminghamensis]|uniref:Uncharacterized protein n=1 Tax=Legionella birminghamensis TaxID=28083 RepID=A0A378IIQ4_9GAMM|nr:hypothetical protein [Legionella birminghamensis]KTC67790.1 hypothetical protein Lbir_3038 [Legionella birminghamensis]STX32054.1 Uncharacterised protein [Legionella birminghamensis]
MRFVYLWNDPDRTLYDISTVPQNLLVIRPNAATTLSILAERLKLLQVQYPKLELNWLECPLTCELAVKPVYLRSSDKISCLYDHHELARWFDKGVKPDPLGKAQGVTANSYALATPKKILEFVMDNINSAVKAAIRAEKEQTGNADIEEDIEYAINFFVYDFTQNPPAKIPVQPGKEELQRLKRTEKYLSWEEPSFIDWLFCGFFKEEKPKDLQSERLLVEREPMIP